MSVDACAAVGTAVCVMTARAVSSVGVPKRRVSSIDDVDCVRLLMGSPAQSEWKVDHPGQASWRRSLFG